MNKRKKPINGLIIISIVAAALLYRGYVQKNPYLGEQLEVFGHMGQWPKKNGTDNPNAQQGVGYIQPQVLDGFTEEPLEGALVVIPEIDNRVSTDSNGYTPNIRVEITVDSRFEDIHPKTWGEITLIVYKEGYREYVLLGLNLWEDQNRQGPKIRLFPKNHQEIDGPMSIIEGPNQLWINSLVEKYRPK